MSKQRIVKTRVEEKAEVDLTPMLDVVFILLIFFIVTATFVRENSLPITTPENQPHKKNSEKAAVLILLEADEQIYVEGRKIDKTALTAVFAQKMAENKEAKFVLRAHEQATAEAYVLVADAVRKAKGGQVSLIPFDSIGKFN